LTFVTAKMEPASQF